MEVKDNILNYLINNKKAFPVEKIAEDLELDSFLVQKYLDELETELKVTIKNNKYIATDYKLGELKTTKSGKFYVNLNGINNWIGHGKLNGAKAGDIVLINTLKTNGQNADACVINILERNKRNKVGTVITRNGKFFIKSDKDDELIQIYNDAILGQKVIYTKGKLIRDNIYSGSVVKQIGHVDDPKIDIYSKLAEYNVNIPFNDSVMKQVEDLPKEVKINDLKDRKDFRNDIIFTIDGDDSKDLDDAISLKKLSNGNYLLGVHIADVSNYVSINSPLDKEAHERGTSAYPPGCVVPMFPHEISSGICSLFEGVDRLTMSCVMEINPFGKVVNYSIEPSVIHSNKRMTYKNVNLTLNGETPEDYKEFENTLLLMNELKDILRKNREKMGSLFFETSEVKINVDEEGKVVDVYKYEGGEAENLIEEFMLLANTTVSNHLTKTGNPSIYRIHELPNNQKVEMALNIMKNRGLNLRKNPKNSKDKIELALKTIQGLEDKDIYTDLLLRSMSRARYSSDNCGHYGLGFEDYTHFTSPIRRYPDLTVHRLLKEYQKIEKKDIAYKKQMKNYLAETAFHSSLKERNADLCEKAVRKMKMAEYMEDKIGNIFTGKIYSLDKYGMNIELGNGIMGMISYTDIPGARYSEEKMIVKTPYKLYNLGDNLTLELIRADKYTGQIEFKEKVLKK